MTVEPTATHLDGRLAIVTGAAQGIGKATALALAAFGADVAICDRKADGLAATAAEIDATGRKVNSAVLDVRDRDAVNEWVAGIDRVDVLVNNAGGGFRAHVLDVSPKGTQALIDENFTQVLHFVRACAPKMPEGGSIVNVTSIEASRAAPGFGVYAAMKAGVEQLSCTLALELSPQRIRVNSVAPDAIPTPGDADLSSGLEGTGQGDYGDRVPLGWGTVDDCAAAVVFLACDLSRWITGTTLHVDGGTNAARGWILDKETGVWLP